MPPRTPRMPPARTTTHSQPYDLWLVTKLRRSDPGNVIVSFRVRRTSRDPKPYCACMRVVGAIIEGSPLCSVVA